LNSHQRADRQAGASKTVRKPQAVRDERGVAGEVRDAEDAFTKISAVCTSPARKAS
jgi:hypothetical protein